MSLGRLLTSGKSLVGLHNAEGRYEMRPKNLLPKFGSDKNPFMAAKPQSLQAEFSRKLSATARTLTDVELEAAKRKKTQPLPKVTALKTDSQAISGSTVKTQALAWFGRIAKKANPLNWFAGRKSAVNAASRLNKAPVQVELSLEKIKVVRNDLSDADLEVVPVKISVKPKPESVAPPAKAGETAELIKV